MANKPSRKGYDSARIRAALACAYIGSSLPLKALEQLDIALDKAPDHAFAHYLKAIAHLHRRAVHSAEKSIQAALALEPDDADYIGLSGGGTLFPESWQ